MTRATFLAVILTGFYFFLLFCALLAFALPAQAGVVRSPSEWVSGLPINGGAYVVYAVADWVQGVAMVTAQTEVTNDNLYVVGIGSYLMRSDGAYITRPTMVNVIPEEHHQVLTFATPDVVPHPGWWAYYVVLYAVSSAGDGWIRVEPGYGEIAMTSLGMP